MRGRIIRELSVRAGANSPTRSSAFWLQVMLSSCCHQSISGSSGRLLSRERNLHPQRKDFLSECNQAAPSPATAAPPALCRTPGLPAILLYTSHLLFDM